jgi:hypothetical protein
MRHSLGLTYLHHNVHDSQLALWEGSNQCTTDQLANRLFGSDEVYASIALTKRMSCSTAVSSGIAMMQG